MAGKGKINILIMREDAGVTRLKFGSGFLSFCVWTIAAIVAFAGIAGYAAYVFREQAVRAEAEAASLVEKAEAAKGGLVKLADIETVLSGGDRTELKTLLGSYNAGSAESLDCPEKTEEPKETPEKGQDKDCPALDLRALFERVDKNLAGVDNFKIALDGKKVGVTFDLSNISPQSALSGDAELLLLTNDGALHPLKTKREDLSFQIQRFKQVAAWATLPQKIEPDQIFGVRMLIKDSSGAVFFSNIFPYHKG